MCRTSEAGGRGRHDDEANDHSFEFDSARNYGELLTLATPLSRMCDRETGSFASPLCSGFAVFVATIGTRSFDIGKMLPSADVCTLRQRERCHSRVIVMSLNLICAEAQRAPRSAPRERADQ
jgi:hypothetical protein